MNYNLIKNQYRRDIFAKLNFPFKAHKKLLDVGCGEGADAEVFTNIYNLSTTGTDIYKDKNLKKIKGLIFKKATIYKLPFGNNEFDYVFLHDVLHHIDEKDQKFESHRKTLKEVRRVVKRNGSV